MWQRRTPLNICKLPFIYVEDHTFLLDENMFSKVWQLRNLKPSGELRGAGGRLPGQAERAQRSRKWATESRGLCPMPRSGAQHAAIITASFKRKTLSTAQFTPSPLALKGEGYFTLPGDLLFSWFKWFHRNPWRSLSRHNVALLAPETNIVSLTPYFSVFNYML